MALVWPIWAVWALIRLLPRRRFRSFRQARAQNGTAALRKNIARVDSGPAATPHAPLADMDDERHPAGFLAQQGLSAFLISALVRDEQPELHVHALWNTALKPDTQHVRDLPEEHRAHSGPAARRRNALQGSISTKLSATLKQLIRDSGAIRKSKYRRRLA
eukprot:5213295-Alexandrium_andersonii.AAC.1